MEQQIPPVKAPEEEHFMSSKMINGDDGGDNTVVNIIGKKQDYVKIHDNTEHRKNGLDLSENDSIFMKCCVQKETNCQTEEQKNFNSIPSCLHNVNSLTLSQITEIPKLSVLSDEILKSKNVHAQESENEKQHEKDVCEQQFEHLFDSSRETDAGRACLGKSNDMHGQQDVDTNGINLKESHALIIPKSNDIDKFSILDCDNRNNICLSKSSDIPEYEKNSSKLCHHKDDMHDDVGDNVKDDFNEEIKDSTISCNDKCETEESSKSKMVCEEIEKTDIFGWKEEDGHFPNSCEPCCKAPIIDNTDKTSESNLQLVQPQKGDPFTLSGDEDFSPKAYKPIKRKLSQRFIDIRRDEMNHFDDLLGRDGENGNSTEQKRQKLVAEDFSLSDRKPLRVAYVFNKELVEKVNKLVRIERRANLVHSLIEVYGILQYVELATDTEILGFHCPMYIDFLKKMTDCDDPSDPDSAEAEAYGLSYDCPCQEEVFETASLISGGTIAASESLINGAAGIAINWCGGWHHAKRDSASGFCYINDIVLGILKLREKFDRVLYVDLDLHHGDGVEEAFYMTPKVMTVSFHKYDCGFFPGSGPVEDVGSGRGKLYTVNVPLLDGISDAQFFSIFTSVMRKVKDKFHGEALVIQCGADTLSEDPMASFNLTHVAIAKCVCFLLTWNLPTLLLGGGGYNFPNTAKCWTFLTAMAAGKKLPMDIPEHEKT